MKKNRIPIKFIAGFMAFMVALVGMPLQAIALGLENIELIDSTVNDNTIDETVSESEQEVFIVEEDLSKRGQFEKHYLCSDGTYVSVTYPEAIHYLDANNKWQDVDQSLTYDSASGMYISDKANFEVSFSNKASADNIARIERNGYTLSWGIQTTKKNGNALSRSAIQPNSSIDINTDVVLVPSSSVSAIIENSIDNKETDIKDRLVANSDTFALPKISSQISYSNIFDETQNVSLKYTVYHNKIEEDIIIFERGDLQSVSMNMDVGTLTPIVNADGSVDLVDANHEMQFHIGIPYMVDADHNVCNDIQVTAVKDGTSCVITYTPNTEWFESSERVFPILLDPSITTNDYVSNIEDTYVEQNTTTNHSSEQHLYFTPNETTGNRRNIIVRVTKLPEIDASMPIISATLTLTAQYAPLSDVSLKAGYLDTGLELSEYDYGVTTSDYYSYTAYSYLNTGSTQVIFDFSSHIYEMYSDLEFDQEYGYDYHGDFVIGYSDNTDTTYAYPFYSANYATASDRPVFTVKYGYTLPAGMLNGNIYSFRSCGSYSYMSVNGTSPAANSNIYQVWKDNDIAATNQKFKLEYVSATGGYLLRSMSSSSGTGMVVSINRAGNELGTNMNVRLSSATDSIAQEWFIIPIDYDVFRIVPRANMSLGLTAYGYDDGTNTGTTSTSQGNIFVQTLVSDNSYQEWYIYDNSNNEVNTSQYRATIETGNYFLGNDFTGRYLHRTGNVVNGMSGMISSLGEETVKWQIVNLGDGYCTIQRSDTPHYYLAPTGTTSGSGVRVYSSVSETIPENYKWSIRSASGGGCIIQHKVSGLYLSGVSSTANPSSVCIYALNTPGTDAYSKQVWRVANEDYYVELGIAASFNDIDIDVGETKSASVKKSPSNASWAGYSDFDYTITSGGDYVSYDAITHKFMGTKPGTASITATHKTTGISDTITITVSILKLFETSRRPGLESDGTIARDMKISDLTKAQLTNINVNLTDLAYRYDLPPASSSVLPPQGPESLIQFMEQLPGLFAAGNADMRTVVNNMVGHFIAGTGGDFSDPTLTSTVQNHSSTTTFVNNTIQVLSSAINNYEGDIASLALNTSFLNNMDNVSEPAYNTSSDYTNGLKIALNGIWGYDMEVVEYEFDGVNYSGTIRYTIFDHFGLDEGDITDSSITSEFLGYTAQFGSWFVLQRYVNCNSRYKPFVTYIVFEQTFSGSIS